jgi:glucokinase
MTPFVVVSGLPGSGKTTLGRRLALALKLPLIDKDDILDRLFDTKGIGDSAWRRTLSRESDAILRRDADAADGAVLVSFWRQPGMPDDSGTPTEWLRKPSTRVVHVHCVCGAETAATRFLQRTRHPGHLDSAASYPEVLASLRALKALPPIAIGERIDVDTSAAPELNALLLAIHAAFDEAV